MPIVKNGFVVHDAFLTPAEVEEWRTIIDEAVTGRGRERIPGFGQEAENDGYYNNVFVQRVNLWQNQCRCTQAHA